MTSPRHARRGAAQRGAASAFGHERWNVRRWHEERRHSWNNGVRLLRALAFTRGCSRATGQQHVHGPLFIDLPELELRAVQDKPPGLLVFSPSCFDGTTLAHIRTVRIAANRVLPGRRSLGISHRRRIARRPLPAPCFPANTTRRLP